MKLDDDLAPGMVLDRRIVDGAEIVTRAMLYPSGVPSPWVVRFQVVEVAVRPEDQVAGDELVRDAPALGLVVVRREVTPGDLG